MISLKQLILISYNEKYIKYTYNIYVIIQDDTVQGRYLNSLNTFVYITDTLYNSLLSY